MKFPLAIALVGVLGGVASAQTPDGNAPTLLPSQKLTRTYEVKLNNIKPSIMAWWLEPQTREVPQFAPVRPEGAPRSLPDGVQRIVAVDPQNALLVFATEDGAMKMAEIVKALDKPLRQIELEAQFVQLEPNAMAKAGFPSETKGFFRGNFNAALNTLLTTGKAKVITAPRVTTTNKTPTPLKAEYGTPAALDISRSQKAWDSQNRKAIEEFSKSGSLSVFNSRSWLLTPQINEDETVTLSALGTQSLQLRGMVQTAPAIIIKSSQPTEFIANLRDGETILVPETSLSEPTDKSQPRMFVLLTARLVRRMGD